MTYDQIIARLNHIKADPLLGEKQEIHELPNILKLDESIEWATSGIYDGGNWVIVCTNLRLLLIDKGTVHQLKQIEFTFESILKATDQAKLFHGNLTLTHEDCETVITHIAKDALGILAETLTKQLQKMKEKPPACGKLLQLVQQLELGVITEVDFNRQKQEILEQAAGS